MDNNNQLLEKRLKRLLLTSIIVSSVVILAVSLFTLTRLEEDEKGYVILMILLFAAFMVGFHILMLSFLKKNVIRPLVKLNIMMDSYEHGDVEVDLTPFEKEDEFRRIAAAFDHMTSRIHNYYEKYDQVKAVKERMDTELRLAAKIQMDMLVDEFPAFPEIPAIDVYATIDPAKECGGDFYDLFKIDEDHVAFVMADVSSKGVPAALYMAIAKALIKSWTIYGNSPEYVFTKVNNQLCDENDLGTFVTAWLGVLEISTGVLTFVNAGHEPFLIRRDGVWHMITPEPGFVLAGIPDFPYESYVLQLQPGDRIYTYTDGVPDEHNPENELFTDERLLESMRKHGDEELPELLKHVREDIDEFSNGSEQFDDITMLVFEYRGVE